MHNDKENLNLSSEEIIGLEEALVMSIPLPMNIIDHEGNILYANEVMQGLVEGRIIGKKCWEVYRDDKTQCPDCPLHEGVKPCKTVTIESEGVFGEKIFQISHTGMLFGGKPAVLEIFYDITEQKKLIEVEKVNLRQQISLNQLANILLFDMSLNEVLEKAMEHICNDAVVSLEDSAGIFLVDQETNQLVLTVNHNLSEVVSNGCARVPIDDEKFCGYTGKVKEIQFRSCLDENHPKCCNGTPPHGHYSVPILYGDELLGVIIFYLKPDHSFNSQEVRFLKMVSNLLANLIKNKEAEKQINQLSQVVMQSSNVVVITNKKGNIEYVNNKFSELTGYSFEEVKGKNPRILKSGETSQEEYEDLWKTILKGDVWRGEFQNKKKNGESYWQSATISAIKDKNGDITHFAAVCEDLTEQKLIQKALAEANRELVGKDKETSKMLDEVQKAHKELKSAQSQLVQSEKLASLGHLSAGVAHEINNPLAFISSNMEILDDYLNKLTELIKVFQLLKDSVQQKDLERAQSIIDDINQMDSKYNTEFMLEDVSSCLSETQEGLDRIQKIVSDLRVFTRKDEEKFESANIEEILDGMINIVWNELRYKVELKKSYGNIPPVTCNAQKLGQVFINLLMNAAQAMEEKGVIELKTYQAGEKAVIEVSDTGSGIPKEKIEQIFDPFFTTKKVGEGTGLGLSVSYDIIQQHKGEMTVESEVGKGTTFKIQLPLTLEDQHGQKD